MKKYAEHGLAYKASPKAFVTNYIIAAGVVAFAFLAASKFGIGFTLVPETASQLMGNFVITGFGVLLFYLVFEFAIEGSVKKYYISTHDIIKLEGIVWKSRSVIPFQSVSEVVTSISILGRLFNYGTVRISGFKENEIVMMHMHDPEEIQRVLQHKIDTSRHGLHRKKNHNEDKDEITLE